MLKAVSKNSEVYRNLNNVGLIYEFFGNNSFSEEELFELGNFLQTNDLMCEFFIINHKGVKNYFISFYKGEVGWANNINNYKGETFNRRYRELMSLKGKIEQLKMFEGEKISNKNIFKLYNLDKEVSSEYRKNLLKKYGYNGAREKLRQEILKRHFANYIQALTDNNPDYNKYVLNQGYIENVNYDFYNVDQEIFDVSLKFLTGNKYFLFPFYFKGIEQKSGSQSYQELDLNNITTGFFDNNTISDLDKSKIINSYEYKISIRPIKNINANIEKNQIVIDGVTSEFDLQSVRDPRKMFFEFQHSIFLYTKRPDIGGLLKDFNMKYGTKIELVQSDVPKEFNPQYLSHNKFTEAVHIGHIRNIQGIVQQTKEYLDYKEDGMFLGREFFSNNEFRFNYFDMAGKDADGTLANNANACIIGTSGAGKTYITENRIFKNNKKDQIIVFDNMGNFEKSYHKLTAEEKIKGSIGLLPYGTQFPNIIGNITASNINSKQALLYQILIGPKNDLSSRDSEMIKAIGNRYLNKNLGGFFKFDNFYEFVKSIPISELFTAGTKSLLLNKLDSVNSDMVYILNNEIDFFEEMLKYQKVIFSYGKLLEDADKTFGYYILGILLNLTGNYLSYKNTLPEEKVKYRYTSVLYDEAHQVVGKTDTLTIIFNDFVRQIRNNKSNIVIITQELYDIPKKLLGMLNFFIILDPNNWKFFKKEVIGLSADNLTPGVENVINTTDKNSIIVENLSGPLQAIEQQYALDSQSVSNGLLQPKDAVRFCVFNYRIGKQFFVVNTKI